MSGSSKFCACGRRLHFPTRSAWLTIKRLCKELGDYHAITVNGRTWLVQRYYIALHGLKRGTLPQLAEELGFEEITDKRPLARDTDRVLLMSVEEIQKEMRLRGFLAKGPAKEPQCDQDT